MILIIVTFPEIPETRTVVTFTGVVSVQAFDKKYSLATFSPAPPPAFIFPISCIDTDQHIPNIRGITYCPGDTLQMHLGLMIYHGEGSTKTISKPDTLTSDFKKFPSNLFDL